MATAHGIVVVGDKPEKFSVTARVVPDGAGHLYLKGRVADTFPQHFGDLIAGVRQIAEYLDCPLLDCADINLRLDTPNNYPLAGASYGLPIGLSILASACSKIIPADYCYTGGIDRHGNVCEVDFIGKKRRGAAGYGFQKLFLPAKQLDMFSTYISQCPCRTLSDAFATTFWRE